MKEEEAKKKWCPHKRFSTPNGGSFNCDVQHYHKSDEAFNCSGSDCMMWERWEWEQRTDNDDPSKTRTMCKGEGDCGLKTKELNCNI